MSAPMRAVVADGAGGPEVLKIVDRPRPEPGNGEILVRVRAAGINRPDVMQRQGNYPPPPGATDVLGLEIAGEVAEAGAGVTRFRAGDRVMALVASGGYADWAVVHETNAIRMPDGMSFAEGGAFPETYFTVWSNLFERAGLKGGETALVHGGSSGIGTTAIMLARAFGASVIVTVGSDEKAKACVELGADQAINYRTEDFVARAKEMTGGKGPEVIMCMVGGPYLQRNLACVAVDGRIAQIAFQQGSKMQIDLLPLLVKRLTLTGSTLRPRPVEMKARLAAALEEHVVPILAEGRARPLIDSTFPLERANEAHARMDSSAHIGKIVLTMDGDGT